jgi:Ca2+-binding EF-hand superfamily protein
MIKKSMIGLTAFGLCSLAFAQGMGMGQIPSFEELDADGSGAVSKEELGKVVPAEALERRFGRLDTDGDGEISAEEFANRPGPPGGMGGETVED